MKQIMITAMQSGGGKTVFTCALLAALKARGVKAGAFKCGPDYIDPMFHSRILKVPCRNLDLFLQGEAGVRRTLDRFSAYGGELAVIEGAMGYYDGIGGTDGCSAWQTAEKLGCPAVLVLRPGGSSLTLAAQVCGLLSFREPSNISGLVLTGCRERLYVRLRPVLERETGLPVLGYLPEMEEAKLPSRHLGLWTAGEIDGLPERIGHVRRQMEQTVDISGLISLAREAENGRQTDDIKPKSCNIAVARDEAFCFYYEDNLNELEAAGANLLFFSPIHDSGLPDGTHGIYLGGGYPELYAKALSENASMRESIGRAIEMGMPAVAECGGFLYLQRSLQDLSGTSWPMAGVLPGEGFKTDGLRRFGYLELASEQDSLLFRKGERAPAHEFHYWECSENGDNLLAQKPLEQKTWRCGFASRSLYAAFPHLHFGGQLPFAKRFVDGAAKWRRDKDGA